MSARELTSAEPQQRSAFVVFDRPPISQPFELMVHFCDSGVTEIAVDAWMPAHQHGMNYTPEIVLIENHVFQVDGMVFHMPGTWQIRIDVLRHDTQHQYTLNVDVR